MRKPFIYLLLLAVLGGGGYFASLHISRTGPVSAQDRLLRHRLAGTDEHTPLEQVPVIYKSGQFNPAARDSDDLHRGRGGVSIVNFMNTDYLVFADDFHVTQGPDYKIYLLDECGVETEERFKQIKDNATQLASMRQFQGYQVFKLPPPIAPGDIQGVLIWCEAFSEFISNVYF